MRWCDPEMAAGMNIPGLEQALEQFGQAARLGIITVAQLSESVTELIAQLAKLPGIGRKSAERLAYHLLRVKSRKPWRLPMPFETYVKM